MLYRAVLDLCKVNRQVNALPPGNRASPSVIGSAKVVKARIPGSLADLSWRGLCKCCNAGLDLLLPPRCNHCDTDMPSAADGLLLCEECRRLLGPETWPCCRGCGASLPEELAGADQCGWCRNGRFRFDAVVPLGAYWGSLRDVILHMKHRAGDRLSATLGHLYTTRRGAIVDRLEPDLVIPVPMHWRRRVVRGTNSATILAGKLASYLHLPLEDQALIRCRNTPPQADLPPSGRFRNVRGAFRLDSGYPLLEGAKVLLVDDVLTSGATCSEAAKVLKQAGAAAVVVAVLGRAEGAR